MTRKSRANPARRSYWAIDRTAKCWSASWECLLAASRDANRWVLRVDGPLANIYPPLKEGLLACGLTNPPRLPSLLMHPAASAITRHDHRARVQMWRQCSSIDGARNSGTGKFQRNLHHADLAVVVAEIPIPQSDDARAATTIAGAHLLNCRAILALEHGRSLSRSAAIACNPIQEIVSLLIRDESNILSESKGEDIKRINGIVLSFTGLNSVRSRLYVDAAKYLAGINSMHAADDRLCQRLRPQRRAEAPMWRRSLILHRQAIATPPT